MATPMGNGPLKPRPKVAAGMIAGALTTVVVYLVQILTQPPVVIPGEVAAAITTVFMGLAGYFMPEA